MEANISPSSLVPLFAQLQIPKTAGTTVAGVARHITNHQASGKDMICNIRAGHEFPRGDFLNYKARNKAKSFLWSFIRNPADRLVSSFFYHVVTKKSKEPSFENFLAVRLLCAFTCSELHSTRMSPHLSLSFFFPVGTGAREIISIRVS